MIIRSERLPARRISGLRRVAKKIRQRRSLTSANQEFASSLEEDYEKRRRICLTIRGTERIP